ncbi:phage major capsid protein [Bacillus sp. SIMBA_154]|uniref:phage major capsid protein n=1 Tax=Bacillus sp. SIMBA_154 TaxID=3080859 RepID=UPI00397B5BD1
MNIKKILENRKKQIEKRMTEIRETIEGEGAADTTLEELQAEVDELAAELAEIKKELDKSDDNKDGGAGDTTQTNEEGRSATSNKEQEKRSALADSILSSLSSRSRTEAKEGEVRKGFAQFVAGQISASEARAMGLKTNGNDIFVPDVLASEILTYAQEENPLRKHGTVYRTTGTQGFPILIKKSKANRHKDERGKNEPIPETDISFEEYALNPSETDALVLVTKKLLARTDLPIEQVIIDDLKKAYVEEEASFFFNGADNPGSLFKKAVKFTTTETDPYNRFVRLKNTLPTAILKQARWMTNRAGLTLIETLKDKEGRPLLRETGIEGKFGEAVLNFPVEVSDYVDGDNPEIPRFFFGDFSKFRVQDVIGSMEVTKLTERYSDTNHIGLKIWNLNDGQLVQSPLEPAIFHMELNPDGSTPTE